MLKKVSSQGEKEVSLSITIDILKYYLENASINYTKDERHLANQLHFIEERYFNFLDFICFFSLWLLFDKNKQ